MSRRNPCLTLAAAALCLAALGSCGTSSRRATLWTDSPDMAQYAEAFNQSQQTWRIETVWRESPATLLAASAKERPALVAARWLKSAPVRRRFRPLDKLFTDLKLSRSAFYPKVLAMGKVDGRQLFLPVSFNLPAVVFPASNAAAGTEGFSITLDSIRMSAKSFNRPASSGFARMGFSPRWDPEFLLLVADMRGAEFREGKPLAWSQNGLAEGIRSARAWVADANGTAADEDEFQFKYLFDPGYRSVAEGRILYSYLDSRQLFRLPEDKRAPLDYRWVSRDDGKIPVTSDTVYLGLCSGAPGSAAAEAFVSWFFREDSQRLLLDRAKEDRTLEKDFGIAGGFSSLRQVNERDYLASYPALVGHLPQDGDLEGPATLGPSWPTLKEKVVLPYLEKEASAEQDWSKDKSLETTLQEWLKENPQ